MLQQETLKALLELFDSTETEKTALSPEQSPLVGPNYRAVRNLLNQYLCHLVGYPIRLQKFIDNI